MPDEKNKLQIISPSRSLGAPVSRIQSKVGKNPLIKFFDKLERANVQERRLLVQEYTALGSDLEALTRAIVSHEKSLVELEFIDDILEREREDFKNKLEDEKDTRDELRQISRAKRRREVAEETLKLEMEQKKLYQFRNPSEQKAKQDPKAEAIKNALAGGGYYRQIVKAAEEALIKQRGGADKLTEVDQERIQNARLAATLADEGRS